MAKLTEAQEWADILRTLARRDPNAECKEEDHDAWCAADFIEAKSAQIAELQAECRADMVEIDNLRQDNARLEAQIADLKRALDTARHDAMEEDGDTYDGPDGWEAKNGGFAILKGTDVGAEPPSIVIASDPVMGSLASLAAAISLLERTPLAKKAAPSDKVFRLMMADYRAALDKARAAIRAAKNATGAVLMPGEPTEAMLVAGLKECDILGELVDWRGPDTATRDDMKRIYAALFAASPLSQRGQT